MQKREKKARTSGRSSWHKDADFRLKNRWLKYSSKIARRVLAAIDETEGLSQVKLAEKLNVKPQRISTIVSGKENLTLETIYNLSQALGVELIEFPDYKFSTKNLRRNIDLTELFAETMVPVSTTEFFGVLATEAIGQVDQKVPVIFTPEAESHFYYE